MKKQLGARVHHLAQLQPEDVSVSRGRRIRGSGVNDRSGQFVFEKNGRDRRLDLRMQGNAQRIRRIPSRLDIGVNQDLSEVFVVFGDSQEGKTVRFGPYDIKRGAARIELEESQILEGREYIEEKGYDTISLEGVSNEDEIDVAYLDAHEIMGSDEEETTIELDDIPDWSWTKGAKVTNMPKPWEDQLWARVVELHQALSRGEVEKIKVLLKYKADDMAQAMGQTGNEIQASLVSFFEKLTNQEGWGMKPLTRDDFKCTIINDRVVRLEGKDGIALLQSLEIKDSYGEAATFALPVYMARIKGQWQIIR
jgi:hypothetical protein